MPNALTEKIMDKTRKRRNWSEKKERIFIEIWKRNAEELRGPRKHMDVYEDMAKEIFVYGFIMSAAEVKAKIFNLTAKYKKEKTGSSPYTWCMYPAVHEIIGDYTSVSPSQVHECKRRAIEEFQMTELPTDEERTENSPSVSCASTCSCAERRETWNTIGHKLGKHGEIYKKRWRNLCDRYASEAKNCLEFTQVWANKEMLSFLNDFIRPSISILDPNIPSPTVLNEKMTEQDDDTLDMKDQVDCNNSVDNEKDNTSKAQEVRPINSSAEKSAKEPAFNFEENISKPELRSDEDSLDMKDNIHISKNNNEFPMLKKNAKVFNIETNLSKHEVLSDDNEIMMYALAKKMRRLPMRVKIRLQEKFLQDINIELLQLECDLENS